MSNLMNTYFQLLAETGLLKRITECKKQVKTRNVLHYYYSDEKYKCNKKKNIYNAILSIFFIKNDHTIN